MWISRVLSRCLNRKQYPIPNIPGTRHPTVQLSLCQHAAGCAHTADCNCARSTCQHTCLSAGKGNNGGGNGGSGGFGIYQGANQITSIPGVFVCWLLANVKSPGSNTGTAAVAHTTWRNVGRGRITPLLFSGGFWSSLLSHSLGAQDKMLGDLTAHGVRQVIPLLWLYFSSFYSPNDYSYIIVESFCSPVYSTAYKDAVYHSHVVLLF